MRDELNIITFIRQIVRKYLKNCSTKAFYCQCLNKYHVEFMIKYYILYEYVLKIYEIINISLYTLG